MPACPLRTRNIKVNKKKFLPMWSMCLTGKTGNKMRIKGRAPDRGRAGKEIKPISVEKKSEQTARCVESDHVASWGKVFQAEGTSWV